MSIKINEIPLVQNINILNGGLNSSLYVCSISLLKKPYIFDAILLNTNEEYKMGYKQEQVMKEFKNFLINSLDESILYKDREIKYWELISAKSLQNTGINKSFENIKNDILDNNYINIFEYIQFLSNINNLNIILINESGKYIQGLKNNIKYNRYFMIIICKYLNNNNFSNYELVGIKSTNNIDIQTLFAFTNPILKNILNNI